MDDVTAIVQVSAEQLLPLETPPVAAYDLADSYVCPECGSLDPAVQRADAASVAKCPQCQCCLKPAFESVAKNIIKALSRRA